MIIKEIKIYSKTHFIKTNLLTASYNHTNRDSWIIEITNSNHIDDTHGDEDADYKDDEGTKSSLARVYDTLSSLF